MTEIKNVVILGANGTMGASCGEVFAAGGCHVVFLARSADKARQGVTIAQNVARSERIAQNISVGSYEKDLEPAVSRADLIFESLAEDMDLKKSFFERVDRYRGRDSIVASVSSGLSITEMARGRSEGFRRNFLGMHFYNPPNVLVGVEVVPQRDTAPTLVPKVVDTLQRRFARVAIVTADKPAFAGNRIGFKVLNDVAILAGDHGPAFADYLIGGYTGRSMTPLATIDLVGWDVHKAVVDNIYENTDDEAHASFAMPAYMQQLLDKGHMGDKTPERGGFYRRVQDGSQTITLVLDSRTGTYRDAREHVVRPIPFVEKVRELNRVGRYRDAFKVFADMPGQEADLARRIILGYVSYAFNRVGETEVVRAARDVDRIMMFGFNWASPSMIVDLIGSATTIRLLEKHDLPIPPLLERAAERPQHRMFQEPFINVGHFFAG